MTKAAGRNFSAVMIALLTMTLVACGGNSDTDRDMETETTETNTSMGSGSDTTSAPAAKLNINTASGSEFQTIPNVGDRMVHEFEEYRPYVSIRQFRQEIGKYVDEEQVAGYEEYIYVPIHRNDSDAETLMQIPGLERSEADQLISQRPFDSNEAFFSALSSFISQEQLATAKTYMKAE